MWYLGGGQRSFRGENYRVVTFADHLEDHVVPRWRHKYFPYGDFKKRLRSFIQLQETGRLLAGEERPEVPRWIDDVEHAAMEATQFVQIELAELDDQLKCLEERQGQNADAQEGQDERNQVKQDKTKEVQFLARLEIEMATLKELKVFAEINHAAVWKILAKFDMHFKTDKGMTQHFPRILESSGLAKVEFAERFEKLRKISLSTKTHLGLKNATFEVVRLAAGVNSNQSQTRIQENYMMFFSLGILGTLLLTVVGFAALPGNREPFNVSFNLYNFLTPFASYAAVLGWILTLWGIGFVKRTCDTFGISYAYLLDINPRNLVPSNYFYRRAIKLSVIWILLFGWYIVDYKWAVLPCIGGDITLGRRSSMHYSLYPFVLTVITLSTMFLNIVSPATKHFRKQSLLALKRVSLAPCYEVTFFDNIAGDVLTSWSKPLAMVPQSVCYAFSTHPLAMSNVNFFKSHHSLCPAWEKLWLEPVLIGLPYWFRAMQCLRRYSDSGERKHLCNFGKYCASLLVVIASAFLSKNSNVVLLISVVATLYAASWDLVMDWGLTWQTLHPSEYTDQKSRSPRLFKPCTYVLAAVFDVLARFSWVQSILPSTQFTSDCLGAQLIVLCTAALERARRSVWCILRLEWEQISNASKFRDSNDKVPTNYNKLSKLESKFEQATN